MNSGAVPLLWRVLSVYAVTAEFFAAVRSWHRMKTESDV